MDAINDIVEKLVEERIRIRDHERIAKVKASNLKNFRAWRSRNPDELKKRNKIYRSNSIKRKQEALENTTINNHIETPCV